MDTSFPARHVLIWKDSSNAASADIHEAAVPEDQASSFISPVSNESQRKTTNGIGSKKLPSPVNGHASFTNSISRPQTLPHMPHVPHRKGTEDVMPASQNAILAAQTTFKNPKDSKTSTPPSPVRKSSWISNISSKFSSSNTTAPTTPTSAPNVPHSNSISSAKQVQAPATPGPIPVKDSRKAESPSTQAAHSPKSGSTSFIHNALRRLSSSSGVSTLGKASTTGGVCPRQVLNKDPYRERCEIDDLRSTKLRRVAFCVDVEIAGPARYVEEERAESPSPPARRPSLTQIEQQIEAKKKKDKKWKEKGEAEALKNPTRVLEEKQRDAIIKATGENLEDSHKELGDSLENELKTLEAKEPSRKKEKRRRSEEERKERKERKKQQAVANGTVPVELSRSSSSTEVSSLGSNPPAKPQDRPTTDPLRIYRRCCQLRESAAQKRIVEQLSSPSAYDLTSPGLVGSLDLTGFVMLLIDLITLGDFLAVVPLKRLILEDCGLTDEAVRVVLAGLLSAKTTEQTRHNRHLAKNSTTISRDSLEQRGVIEKLSLKNNPRITRDGWKHISLFIYMSRSLKAIDLSMIPFPYDEGPVTSSEGAEGKLLSDMIATFSKAVGSRLGGPRLEELVMGDCKLNTEVIEAIIEAIVRCGCTRLGLANNDITEDGLKSITKYLSTGKCEGLDLGGNDLSNDLTSLCNTFGKDNALYALSLANCNLSPASIRPFLHALLTLPNFRFVDLSHNHNLFTAQPSALHLLRKHLPQMLHLKRLHLADVDMSSEDAIALAEVLPEVPNLAHLNILKNPKLKRLASAESEEEQEEACALYASLMATVRVSKTIVNVDIEVPTQNSSEIVKALAKQVVAYSLRNMERNPELATSGALGETSEESNIVVPDILYHLVGHVDGSTENHDDDPPAPDADYIVGGTGVVKALGVCLTNLTADSRRVSRDITTGGIGTVTPDAAFKTPDASKGKAKDVSKNLLDSARKIRARLQPALAREVQNGNEIAFSKSDAHDQRD